MESSLPTPLSPTAIAAARLEHARIIASSGGLEKAIATRNLPRRIHTTLAEVIVLGLLRQEVRTFVCVLGHGSTEIGEVLRVYAKMGLLRVFGVRSEIEASHAAAALRWVTGEKAAVVTSIGPGALQALAASLTPASNGLGVWYLVGDETTEDEGPNMQQIPRHAQGRFLQLFSTMGDAYCLHTPQAIGAALNRGLVAVEHPHRPGPFFLLMPLNTQPAPLNDFNLEELPCGTPPRLSAAADEGTFRDAARALHDAQRVVVKVGGGARGAGAELMAFLDQVDGVAVLSPLSSGVIPYSHPRNMLVGGSKGTLCGNFAMEEADLAVVIGSRAVCQSDCSRTGYLHARYVININTDPADALHYRNTLALVGDAAPTLRKLLPFLHKRKTAKDLSPWLSACLEKRQAWEAYKAQRFATPSLYDPVWNRPVLTQPAVIKAATDWARGRDVTSFFDAGDVQAHGFQIVEDDRLGRTFTDTGASYMGFACSALLATALSNKPFYGLAFTGDGSFTMNPQILIDGVAHGVRGCILLLDNRRMAAISALQVAQYGESFATEDGVAVDYVGMARAVEGCNALSGGPDVSALLSALEQAFHYPGLSLIHVPVYYGPDPMGSLGAFGRWNVGNWVLDTQRLRHSLSL